MAISIRCENPDCRKPVRVKDEAAGKRVKCPGCGQHIMVPPQKPAMPSRDATEEPAPQVEPFAVKDPKRPARRAVGLWLVGMAAMLLVGAGGGYFLSPSQLKKGEDHAAQSDTRSQELARANADLTKQLAAAEQRAKEASAANGSELNDLRAQLQTAKTEAATANAELAKLRTDKNPSPTPPSEPIWAGAKWAKLTFVVKKAHTEKVEAAELPKAEGKDFDASAEKFNSAILSRPLDGSAGASSLAPDGDGGFRVTLSLPRETIDVWPKDGAELKKVNVWGREFLPRDKKFLQFNLILSGTQDAEGVIKGKVLGVLADGVKFQGTDFELVPVKAKK